MDNEARKALIARIFDGAWDETPEGDLRIELCTGLAFNDCVEARISGNTEDGPLAAAIRVCSADDPNGEIRWTRDFNGWEEAVRKTQLELVRGGAMARAYALGAAGDLMELYASLEAGDRGFDIPTVCEDDFPYFFDCLDAGKTEYYALDIRTIDIDELTYGEIIDCCRMLRELDDLRDLKSIEATLRENTVFIARNINGAVVPENVRRMFTPEEISALEDSLVPIDMGKLVTSKYINGLAAGASCLGRDGSRRSVGDIYQKHPASFVGGLPSNMRVG